MTRVNVKDIYNLVVTSELHVSTEELRPSLDIRYRLNNSYVKVHNSAPATLAKTEGTNDVHSCATQPITQEALFKISSVRIFIRWKHCGLY